VSLEERSGQFAAEIQATLDGVLPGERTIISTKVEGAERYLVTPDGLNPKARRIPLFVADEYLADLDVALYLSLDRTGQYLKTVRSDISIHSVLDRTPLLRYDYRSDMKADPVAHWQVYAERGAVSHLLTKASANAARTRRPHRPHDLSSLHFAVGGERFRPCLEDVLQFLVLDCGVDRCNGWQTVVEGGRERWRRRQLGSIIRDIPSEAARILRELGWKVEPPENPGLPENPRSLRTW